MWIHAGVTSELWYFECITNWTRRLVWSIYGCFLLMIEQCRLGLKICIWMIECTFHKNGIKLCSVDVMLNCQVGDVSRWWSDDETSSAHNHSSRQSSHRSERLTNTQYHNRFQTSWMERSHQRTNTIWPLTSTPVSPHSLKPVYYATEEDRENPEQLAVWLLLEDSLTWRNHKLYEGM